MREDSPHAQHALLPWLQAVAPAHAPGTAAWWQAVAGQGTPLRRPASQGPAGACERLFLWRQPAGAPAPQAVYIDVDSHTPHPSEGVARMQALPGTDLWCWPTRLPADWLGSYAFLPVPAGWPAPPESAEARRRWWRATLEAFGQADPCSREPAAADGWGRPRAVLRPAGPVLPQPAGPQQGSGQTWRWHSAQLGSPRTVWLHQTPPAAPDRAGEGQRPWVLLLDGQAWAGPLRLFPRLDQLTAQRQLPAANYLALDARDPDSRWQDMGCQPRFWQALHEELLPEAMRRAGPSCAPLCTPPCLLAGQSLGGLAATYAALHWPERYPALISQSGAFWWPALDEGAEHAWLIRQVRGGLGQGQGLRALFQYGERDPADMQALSRQMAAALQARVPRPAAVQARQVPGGHDWVCWREALLCGLAELLPALQPHLHPHLHLPGLARAH